MSPHFDDPRVERHSATYAGLLRGVGTWLRHPHGDGVENIAEMAAAGVEFVMCNVGDGHADEWQLIRQRCAANRVRCAPWARVRTAADVAALTHSAAWFGAAAVGLNLEAEAKAALTPQVCAETLRDCGWAGEVATVTEPWLYNAVDWTPLAVLGPVVLEIVPQESPAARDVTGCIEHAHNMGFGHVLVAYGAYGEAVPADYDRSVAHWSTYCGDDVGAGSWRLWRRP